MADPTTKIIQDVMTDPMATAAIQSQANIGNMLGRSQINPITSPAQSNVLGGAEAPMRELPPNQPTIESQIDAATIGAYTPDGMSPQDKAIVDALVAAQTPSSATGDLGATTYYPGGSTAPVNVGTVSGQIIGSQPILTMGGGLFPIGVIEARKKALEDAAKAKEAALSKFTPPERIVTKDRRFQRGLDDMQKKTLQGFMSQAQQLYGDKWRVALQSQETEIGRQFTNAFHNIDTLAKEGDNIVDLFAKVDEGIESGDQFYTPETLKLRNDFEQLIGDFEGGNIQGLANFRDKQNQLKGHLDFSKYLHDKGTIASIKGRLKQSAGVESFEEYIRTGTHKTKKFDDDVAVIAKELKETTFRSSPLTEKQIADGLKARLGSEDIRDAKVATKSTRRGSGADVDKDRLNTQQDKLYNIQGANVKSNLSVPLNTTNKPVNLTSNMILDPATGALVESDIRSVVPVEYANVKAAGQGGDIPVLIGYTEEKKQREVKDANGNVVYMADQITPKMETYTERTTHLIPVSNNLEQLRTDMPNATNYFEKQLSSQGKDIDVMEDVKTISGFSGTGGAY